MRRTWTWAAAIGILACTAASAWAGDAYYHLTYGDLKQKLEPGTGPATRPDDAGRSGYVQPGAYIVLDGDGEAYAPPSAPNTDWLNNPHDSVVIRAPEGKDIFGRLFEPRSMGGGIWRFTIPATSADPKGKKLFYQAKGDYFQQLADMQYAGAAIFRHEAIDAQVAAGEIPDQSTDDEMTRRWWTNGMTQGDSDPFALFDGGEALSESLQLDRTLATAPDKKDAGVDVSSITGIDVPPMDWSTKIKGLSPKTDVLAAFIPYETDTYNGITYTKVVPTPQTAAQTPQIKGMAICYVVIGDALIVSPNQAVLHNAIDRELARQTAASQPSQALKPPPESPWLGQSLDFRVQSKLFPLMDTDTGDLQNIQDSSWRNIPILNEYRRRYPNQDPVTVHENLWGVRLIDPSGGKYVWNEKWQTMESTVCGCPGDPKMPPVSSKIPAWIAGMNFGLTFEQDGLRAKAEIEKN